MCGCSDFLCALNIYLLCERGGQHTDPPTTKFGSTIDRCTHQDWLCKDIFFPFTESIFSSLAHPSIYLISPNPSSIVIRDSGSRLLGTRVNRRVGGTHTHTPLITINQMATSTGAMGTSEQASPTKKNRYLAPLFILQVYLSTRVASRIGCTVG